MFQTTNQYFYCVVILYYSKYMLHLEGASEIVAFHRSWRSWRGHASRHQISSATNWQLKTGSFHTQPVMQRTSHPSQYINFMTSTLKRKLNTMAWKMEHVARQGNPSCIAYVTLQFRGTLHVLTNSRLEFQYHLMEVDKCIWFCGAMCVCVCATW